MPPRCPKGTRRNKKTGNCEPKKAKSPKHVTKSKTRSKSHSNKESPTINVNDLAIGLRYNFYLYPGDDFEDQFEKNALRENKITGTVKRITNDGIHIAYLTDVVVKHTSVNNEVHIKKLKRVPINLSDAVKRITVA